MCTVTYVGCAHGAVITSNRDEHLSRKPAMRPQIYYYKGRKLYFPKDPRAGGTWFAVDEDAHVAVLLNGAEEKHLVRNDYVRSRGLILLDLVANRKPLQFWDECSLEGIEPFTIILYLKTALWQLRWNACEKETRELDVAGRHIWSSCTLYDPESRRQRAQWFDTFLRENTAPQAEDIRAFHLKTHGENPENDLVMSRGDHLATFSITQAVVRHNKADLFHRDLIGKQSFTDSFVLI